MKLTELAWAAGFFDGEGYTGTHRYQCISYLYMSVSQIAREPLERFQAAVGTGRIYGPYQSPKPNTRPIWTWRVSGEEAEITIRKLWPYLCSVKKDQAKKAGRKNR